MTQSITSGSLETRNARAHAAADLDAGEILATVEVKAPIERVYRALISDDVVTWWEGEGAVAFRTTSFRADVRVGGKWRTEGSGPNGSYVTEGEYLALESPHKVVMTFGRAGAPPSTVTYLLESIKNGTRLTLRHVNVKPREICTGTYLAWESLFGKLAEYLGG